MDRLLGLPGDVAPAQRGLNGFESAEMRRLIEAAAALDPVQTFVAVAPGRFRPL